MSTSRECLFATKLRRCVYMHDNSVGIPISSVVIAASRDYLRDAKNEKRIGKHVYRRKCGSKARERARHVYELSAVDGKSPRFFCSNYILYDFQVLVYNIQRS